MSTEWEVMGSKKMRSACDGRVVLVAPADGSNIVPLFCPCCEFPMKDINDSISYRNVGVCSQCDNRWTNQPSVTWPQGPDKASKEWKEYIEERAKLSKGIITLE